MTDYIIQFQHLLLLSSMWLLRQTILVLLQKNSGMVHGIIDVNELALGWPTYEYWPKHSMAAGGHAVVVVV